MPFIYPIGSGDMNLQIDVRNEDEVYTVNVKGEIDAYTAPQLKEQLDSIVSEHGVKVIINLEEVSYIDSTGLGIFVGALKSTRKNDGTLQLVGVNDRVKRLFKITGLHEIIDISGEGIKDESTF